jgi:hypothetical protein
MKFDYFDIVRKTWQITWQYKILWLFGFFASGSFFSGNFNYSFPSNEFPSTKKGAPLTTPTYSLRQVRNFIENYLWIIVLAALLFLTLIFFLLLARWLSQPALIFLAAQADNVRPSFLEGLKFAFKILFRFVGLGWLIWAPFLFIFLSLLILFLILLLAPLSNLNSSSAALALPALFFLFIPLILFFALITIPLTVFTAIAQRWLVLENSTIRESITRSWELFKKEWKKLGLLWLISLGLSIVVFFAILISLSVIAIPAIPLVLGLVYAIKEKVTGLVFILGLFASLILLLLIVFFFLLQGFIGAFFYNYWTFAYLKLREIYQPFDEGLSELETA